MYNNFRIGEPPCRPMPTMNQVREADYILASHGIYTNDRTNVCWMVDKARELEAIDDLRSKLEAEVRK